MLRDWGSADIAAGITQQVFFRLESRNVHLPFALLCGASFVAVVGVFGILGLAFPVTATADENNSSPTITVRIYNYSQAPSVVLARAEREAGRILSKAGLRAVWLECPVGPSAVGPQGPCQKTPEDTDTFPCHYLQFPSGPPGIDHRGTLGLFVGAKGYNHHDQPSVQLRWSWGSP